MKISPWRSRDFRLLFTSAATTNLGDGLIAVAVPWLATRLTDDPALIGLVAGGRHLPWLLFSLPAGVLTDRFDHRRLIMAADAVRLVLSLLLVGLASWASAGTGAVLVLAILSFVLGSAEVLRDNTAQTFLPSVVEKPQLEQANGSLWATEQLAGQLLGPPLAGFVIGLSLAVPFGMQTGLLLAALGLIGAMRVRRPAPISQNLPMRAALKEGVLWLWRDRPLRRLALVLGGFNFLGYGFWAVFVIYGQKILHLDAFGYGAILTAAACGGLMATMIGPFLLRFLRPATAILIGMVGFCLASACLAVGAPVWLVAGVLVMDGFTGMLWNIAQVSYRQRHIPGPLLGRVNSAFRFLGTGPAALGALVFGLLISWGDGERAAQLPYAVAALVGLFLTIYSALHLRLP